MGTSWCTLVSHSLTAFLYKISNILKYIQFNLRFHIKMSLFQCDNCPKIFTSLKLLQRHFYNVHHELKSAISCDVCGKQFLTGSKWTTINPMYIKQKSVQPVILKYLLQTIKDIWMKSMKVNQSLIVILVVKLSQEKVTLRDIKYPVSYINVPIVQQLS